MGLHKYSYSADALEDDVPPRPSSANSFSSYEGNNGAHHHRGYNGNSQSSFGRFSGKFGASSSAGTGASWNGRADRLDEEGRQLMNTNAGLLGLDPTNLPPIQKDFYQEHPEVAKMTPSQVEAFRKDAQMTITGKDIPKPIPEFTQAGFPTLVERKLVASGFTKPTPIQSQGWSMALSGRNMVGIAQTGSGKTLSFVLPAIVHILGQTSEKKKSMGSAVASPTVLILAPTRELACQIQDVARVFGNVARLNSTCVYGGAPKGPQIRNVRLGCDILVATPGRLIDLLSEQVLTLERCSFVVLDEADRMLDMGFEPQVRQILNLIRTDRQVLLWSATWPRNVQRLAQDMLGRDFIQVKIGTSELHANRKIKQNVVICPEFDKRTHLDRILQEEWDALPEPASGEKQMVRTIIFCNKKTTVDYLTGHLRHNYWQAVAIHGDKMQMQRDQAIRSLKSGQASILVATDVAARGLDVKDVMLVINFDMPLDIESYVHRIGRTARGSAEGGTSYAFVTSEDKPVVAGLIKILLDAGQTVSSELEAMVDRKRPNSNNNRGYYQRGGKRGSFNRGYQNQGGNYRGGRY